MYIKDLKYKVIKKIELIISIILNYISTSETQNTKCLTSERYLSSMQDKSNRQFFYNSYVNVGESSFEHKINF